MGAQPDITHPPTGDRPLLQEGMSEREFRRWYWLTDELCIFARGIGLSASGGKTLLTERIASALAGRTHQEHARSPAHRTRQLTGPLSHDTLIPRGQRCSQVLRAWFVEQVGPGFRFDDALRRIIGAADGTTTLGDALAAWTSGRDDGPSSIDGQFEYNRFTRAWHAAHPSGSRAELIDAWWAYRARPIDERGRA